MTTDTLTAQPLTMFSKLPIGVLYGAALLQGLAQVVFPASAGVITTTLGLSQAQYGSIFLPQLVGSLLGGILTAVLAKRFTLKQLLQLSLSLNIFSQACLVSTLFVPPTLRYVMLMLATLAVGTAFGVSSSPHNLLPGQLFPKKPAFALLVLHTLIGLGLALGPILAGPLIAAGFWKFLPGGLIAMGAILFTGLWFSALPNSHPPEDATTDNAMKNALKNPVFWGFWLMVALYAFAEATQSNWAVIYLQEHRGYSEEIAAWGLSAFWVGLAVGRMGVSLLTLRIPAERLWQTLPLLVAVSFLLIPYSQTPTQAIALFALGGVGCSAIFPLSISIATQVFANMARQIAPLLISVLMAAIGLASYWVVIQMDIFKMSFEAVFLWGSLYAFAMTLISTLLIAKVKSQLHH